MQMFNIVNILLSDIKRLHTENSTAVNIKTLLFAVNK
jgi:hypothetical protein